MKTRCRNYGATRGMTAGVLHPSRKDSSEKDVGKAGDLNGGVADKEPQVLHETRSQKQTVKNGLQEDHAEIAKHPSSSVVSETTNNSVGVATRSSTRPSKRLKLSCPRANNSGNQENKEEGNVGHETATSPQQRNRRKKKVKRQWESWGKEEKDTFFEAVHEYGKDFDKIRNFIATKHKRRGDPPSLIKNKDQVRHFYYRTLNKIAKYLPADKLNESDNHNKMVVELRGLICYGELRKKICGWHDKHGKKLHDLVSHGTTTIRYNGRNSKIKAPMCRALKRLTSAGQNKEDKDPQMLAMPSKLVLELLPQDYAASAAVQRLAKNPRLRTTVPPKKSLSLMIDFLKQKWRVISTRSLEPLDICIVVPAEFYANSDITDGQIDSPASKNSPSTVGEESTSLMEVTPCAADIEKDVSVLCSSVSVVEKCTAINGSGSNKMQKTAPLELNYNYLSSGLHQQSVFNDKTNDQSEEMKEIPHTSQYVEPQLCSEVVMDSSLVSEPVRQGNKPISRPAFWTSESCGAITFGDIFYKLGKPPKLKLEYTWQDAESNLAPSQTAVALKKLVDIASVEYFKGRDNSEFAKPTSKSSDVSLAKSTRVAQKERATSSTTKERTTMSLPKEKVVPMITRVIPKPVEKLPFILPSVVPPALQTSTNKATITNIPTQKQLSARVRKRTRSNIQRTLLPRPVGSPSSVPPGAVAVSFIPQPGQTVGTILAAGASTSSITTTTHSVTVSSATGRSDHSKLPAGEFLAPSPEGVSEADMKGGNSGQIELDVSGFPETDRLLHVNWKALRDKDVTVTSSVDSIIGLALGTALNVNETNTTMAVMDEDSNSDILESITGLKGSTIPSHPVPGSEVHIEELNYGVAGGVPSSVCSPTLESILNPSAATVQSPVSSSCSVFFSNMAPIASPVDSGIQHKDSESTPPLMLPQSVDSEMNSTFPSFRTSCLGSEPQWLNGEASNFSLGSLLDKLTASPRKEGKDVTIGDSSPNTIKDTSQDALINPHHLLDADTALCAIMDENSVDYVKKFEDLAKEMAGNNSKTASSACSTATLSSILPMESTSRQSDECCSENITFRSILRQNNMNGS